MHRLSVVAIALALAAGPKAPEPKVELRPLKAMINLRVGQCSVDVELKLAIEDKNVEDYYCPRIEWEWEDGTKSTEEKDCTPFEDARPEDHRKTWSRSWAAKGAGTHVFKVKLYKADRLIRIVQTEARVVGWEGMSPEQRSQLGCNP